MSHLLQTSQLSKGLIQVFTGDGKGKTTAALGEVVRSIGTKKKIAVVYFDKGGDVHYSERSVLETLGVTIVVTGRDRIDPETGRFDFSVTKQDKEEAQRGLKETRQLFEKGYDVMMLDELVTSVAIGLLEEDEVLDLLLRKPERTELILTGRHATENLMEKADLVTEMRMIKHYYTKGVSAREGLDY
ncbi:hypothetical protein A2239_02550 [Candidatus Uhrbacteria bacterium RIFOXYA2_FULL_40_9]|nr:MAG: Cob(I)yrinic acid a,c-diamide adenosyltransferase [Candidatus Uhrbacteria bacterium GW2011_GWF2_40_263]OGL93955.1 MAG: hypothetical protein A2239_02550 [Candidatus Uhrbacteria bacterium RIFOXYA2_FULL_40_9]OGL97396.1 MAG: hypothetical protein A2332_04730 [Candidatus Uhrbacteria bacterium RIFOXYB2_FULL_41_18]HBK35014.1 cob(I)yrinic acid a,c-diamide adenosyltransferase [Candidatus Uhrbacteria bacterium]HCB56167.1 cob(I)yrinic acid a,c-diamide adenosyltransferase [Candidatus Uhrbacteria bac